MISENLKEITIYLWQQSTQRISTLLQNEPDFNISDYYYLTVIYYMDHPNFGDVAHSLQLTKPAVSALIKRLMQHKLIKKVQCPDDKRIFHLSLTEKGKQLIEGDAHIYSHLQNILLSNSSPEQLKALGDALELVATLLNGTRKLNQSSLSI